MAVNYGDVVATTLHWQSKDIADSAENNNALLKALQERKNIKRVPGGWEIRETLFHAENSTAGWYSGADPLDVSPTDVVDAANFTPRQASVAVTLTGAEIRMNQDGPTRIISLIEAKVTNAKRSMRNLMDEGIHSDGSGTGGKQIAGLQAYIVDTSTPSGTVGGIPRSGNTFWQNYYRSTSTSLGSPRSSGNILSELDQAYNPTVRGTDHPDLGLFGDADYGFLLEALRSRQVIQSGTLAQAGFESVKHRQMDCVLDGGIGGNIPAGNIYLLNTEYIFLRPYEGAYMEPLDPASRTPFNQDLIVKLLGFMGQLTISAMRYHSLLAA